MIGLYLILAFSISITLFINKNKNLSHVLIILFIIAQWSFTIHECFNFNNIELGYFKADALGLLLLITLSIISIPAFFNSYILLKDDLASQHVKSIYYASMVLLITAISAAYLSNHIAVTWIFVEITTLSASLLIYHYRNELSLEATWKYVFICAISITLVFIGILFLSMATRQSGITDLSFDNLTNKANQFNMFWMKLSFIFIFTGFTAKLGIVPMYTAGIDAKDKAPSTAGGLFASVLMNVGFVGIFRTYTIIAQTPLITWANTIILTTAVISMIVATIYMVKVKNIKRMFAYSGIEHMSLVMLGIAAGGIGYYAAILHVILHAFVKSSIFFQFNQIFKVFKSTNIYDTGYFFKYNKTGALVLLLGFFSATAIPPSGLFISEFLIFSSLFKSHHVIILIGILFCLTMILWAFGKNIFKLLFTPLPEEKEINQLNINPIHSLPQLIILIFAIYLGINPPKEFISLIQQAIILLPQ